MTKLLNEDQYKNSGTKKATTKATPKLVDTNNTKVKTLEELVDTHQKELVKLRREIGRLRSAITDIEAEVNNIIQRRG